MTTPSPRVLAPQIVDRTLESARPWAVRTQAYRVTSRALGLACYLLAVSVLCLPLLSCALVSGQAPLLRHSVPGSVNPTIKIGLSAPFEGRDRDLGYEALYAVRLAVRERNEAGGLAGRYFVELVALNDFNKPEQAVIQARKMAVDRDVLGVLGGWSPATARSAGIEYERLEVPFLAPEEGEIGSWVGDEPAPERTLRPARAGFIEAFQALSGGAPPDQVAFWSYGAANRLLDAIEAAVRAQGQPTRARVWLELLSQKSD